VQGCAEALEAVVRDAGGPDGLYVNLAIPVDACAAVIASRSIGGASSEPQSALLHRKPEQKG
jgi:succinate-semialdehyde dehydrogenase/glutarate-semialdehyde dehydrogenase/succinate-semialdehyde dehydrogenase